MLAHYICASILHGLVIFQKISNTNFLNVTNSCRMLAHKLSTWIGYISISGSFVGDNELPSGIDLNAIR